MCVRACVRVCHACVWHAFTLSAQAYFQHPLLCTACSVTLNRPVWFDTVTCTGSENSLFACDITTLGLPRTAQCDHTSLLYVSCLSGQTLSPGMSLLYVCSVHMLMYRSERLGRSTHNICTRLADSHKDCSDISATYGCLHQ